MPKNLRSGAHVLLRYQWPGNVRELRNVVRRAILLASDVIEPEHLSVLPVDPHPATALRGEPAHVDASLKDIAEAAAADAEQHAIRRVLEITKGKQERGGAAAPYRLQDPPPQDEAVRH